MGQERGESWTILRVLSWTAERFGKDGIPSARAEAEVLLAHCLGVERIRLYTDFDKPMHRPELTAFKESIRRRLAGEPVAYITGTREFWSLAFQVDPAVLIPRPETELLLELALSPVQEPEPGQVMVDVGTGCGALAVVLARSLPGARVFATDLDPRALEVARANAERHGVVVTFLAGDLLQPLPADVVPSLVLSNPPYIPSAEIPGLQREIRDWEPRGALDGGPDGLQVIRGLVAQAALRLGPGGRLILEVGAGQAQAVRDLLADHGFKEVQAHMDLAGIKRAVSGARPLDGPP